MIEYHKIQTVYFRDPANKNRTLLDGQWSMPEFAYLARAEWRWSEKVDGTNIRVGWNGLVLRVGGREKDSQLPVNVINTVQQRFTPELMRSVFPDMPEDGSVWATLYGEGYGFKIQKGGELYLPDRNDFILFDVMVGDLFLEQHNVLDIALKLDVPNVPTIGTGTLFNAIDYCKSAPSSQVAQGRRKIEGLVLRPETELRTRRGERIITKIKIKDFQA